MRAAIRVLIGVLVAVQADAALSAVAAQGKASNACSILTPAEIMQISKQENRFNVPPELYEVRKGVSECSFLSYGFTLIDGFTKGKFDSEREASVKQANVKVLPVADIGDEAYFYQRGRESEHVVAVFLRVGQRRLAIHDMVPKDSIEVVKPTLLALAKAAAPRLK